MYKLIIAGGRGFDNYKTLKEICDVILQEKNEVQIISGTAKGADKLGERYAQEKGYKLIKVPADWGNHGKSAGYKRNEEMAKIADGLIAFWDGKSKGTRHMINLAKKYNLQIKVQDYTL
jgi:hypothetical protein